MDWKHRRGYYSNSSKLLGLKIRSMYPRAFESVRLDKMFDVIILRSFFPFSLTFGNTNTNNYSDNKDNRTCEYLLEVLDLYVLSVEYAC